MNTAVIELEPLVEQGVEPISCVMASMKTAIMVTDSIQVVIDWVRVLISRLDVFSHIKVLKGEVNEVSHFLLRTDLGVGEVIEATASTITLL